MNIVLCYPAEASHVQQIRSLASDAEVIDAGQDGVAEAILSADVFFGHAKVPVPWPEVVQQGRLRWIQSSAAGLDHCLTPEVIASDITVTSASGLFANQVAEQTMALLYGVARKLPAFFRATLKREYIRLPTDDVHGKTIGIVGLGGNGRRIAQVLAPLNGRIIATDYFTDYKPPEVDKLWPKEELHRLLQESDIVILCVPLNEQTTHLMDREAFAAMKRSSVLINVARGAVVDESALIHALESGHLSGAGIDVAEVEPLPQESPLWEIPNVIITPHVGAQAATRVSDTTDFFCRNLPRYLQGEPLLNLVDKRLGFPHPSVRADA